METYYFDIYGLPRVILDFDGLALADDRKARDVALHVMNSCYHSDLFEVERGNALCIKVSRGDGLFVSDILLSINNKPLPGEVRRPAADGRLPNVIPFPTLDDSVDSG